MDREDPFPYLLTLLTSKRLILGNCDSVKLFDVVQNKVLHQLRVDSKPWSVCSLPWTRAAVALPFDNTILILDCDNQLSIVKRIAVRGKVRGVAYSNGHLIVLYSFGKIETLHMNGGIVRQTNLETSGLFKYQPLSVMTEGNVTSIFVYDYNKGRIIRLDENLQEQQVYPLPGVDLPWSVLAVGGNQLLVSDFDGRLWQLDSTMGRWTRLKKIYVDSMAFCHDRHVLYCGFGNIVKSYAIS